jgi:hypothetical protein
VCMCCSRSNTCFSQATEYQKQNRMQSGVHRNSSHSNGVNFGSIWNGTGSWIVDYFMLGITIPFFEVVSRTELIINVPQSTGLMLYGVDLFMQILLLILMYCVPSV